MFVHRAQLVVRIAYAGAPLSGKTETVKSLLGSLHGASSGVTLFSPHEARGRTVYFDWGQYQGGSSFAGPIQCQITSVPGQTNLHRRRRVLVQDADVVVLVLDSQPDQLEANRRSLAEVRPWLERGDLPPIGVLYQANKRDLPGALSLDTLREDLRLPRDVEIFPSAAIHGEGVRACFVGAVRACIQRAEALRKMNRLEHDQPPVTTGEQLLQQLRTAEDEAGADAATEVEEARPEPAVSESTEATATKAPGPSDTAPHPPITGPEPAPVAVHAAPLAASSAAVAARPPAVTPQRRGRPAVIPFADWIAAQKQLEEQPVAVAAMAAVALAPAPVTQRIVPPTVRESLPRRRPAVMPMAAWLAETKREESQSTSATPPVAVKAAAPSPAATSAPAPTAVAPPVPVVTPAPVAAAPPAPAAAPVPVAPPRTPQGPPAPWLPGSAITLQEVWPPPVWEEVLRAAAAGHGESPHRSGEAWQGRIGATWHARSARLLPVAETARTDFRRLVAWLMQLGDMVSGSRCIVLAGSPEGWCVWQVVRHEMTLDLQLRRALEAKVLSKSVVNILAGVATDYVATAQDFALRGAGLPVRLKTLAHENRGTVYSAFLPMAPMPTPERDVLANLAHELRAIVPPSFVGAANVTEALRELERLREERPQMKPTFEVLQHVLIGE